MKIWHCVYLLLKVVSSFGNTDDTGVNILRPTPSACQHDFLCQLRKGTCWLWDGLLFPLPCFQIFICLCQHLVLSYLFFFFLNKGVYSSLSVVLLCFSLFSSEIDHFFIYLWPYKFLLLWSGQFSCCVVYLFWIVCRAPYTLWILVFCYTDG